MFTAQKSTSAPANPLENLQTLLADDMKAVNALTLERLNSDIPLISQIAAYLIAAGGKRIRPLLTLSSARLAGCESERPYRLAAAVEFIHTATLLHDDVVDDSSERRGQASANTAFGNQAPVLVGDFLFSRAFQLMVEDGSTEVLKVLSNASAVIAEGEVLQLSLAGNTGITQEQYFQVIHAKTAALFAAACEIGPLMSEDNQSLAPAMHRFGSALGMVFQITDDVMDYTGGLGKEMGDDFRDGKLTLPVILALQAANDADKAQLINSFKNPLQTSDKDFDSVLTILKTYGAFEASLKIAQTYADSALDSLSKMPSNAYKTHLEALVDYTMGRVN